MLNREFSIELNRRHDGSPYASGHIRIIGETTTVSIPYREHPSRNGSLYLSSTQVALSPNQLHWISELLEVEEAHIAKMRAVFRRAASSLLLEPDVLDEIDSSALARPTHR